MCITIGIVSSREGLTTRASKETQGWKCVIFNVQRVKTHNDNFSPDAITFRVCCKCSRLLPICNPASQKEHTPLRAHAEEKKKKKKSQPERLLWWRLLLIVPSASGATKANLCIQYKKEKKNSGSAVCYSAKPNYTVNNCLVEPGSYNKLRILWLCSKGPVWLAANWEQRSQICSFFYNHNTNND